MARRLGQLRRKGLQYRDSPTLLPWLGKRYGASGRSRLRPPRLTNLCRRRQVAAAPAKTAGSAPASVARIDAADPVHGPPARCRQRDQDRVGDDYSCQPAPPQRSAAPQAHHRQHTGRARPRRRPAEPPQVVPSQRLAHEHDDRCQGDHCQRDGRGQQHSRHDDASAPDPIPPHRPIVRSTRAFRSPVRSRCQRTPSVLGITGLRCGLTLAAGVGGCGSWQMASSWALARASVSHPP
jgi:hypothetical protein